MYLVTRDIDRYAPYLHFLLKTFLEMFWAYYSNSVNIWNSVSVWNGWEVGHGSPPNWHLTERKERLGRRSGSGRTFPVEPGSPARQPWLPKQGDGRRAAPSHHCRTTCHPPCFPQTLCLFNTVESPRAWSLGFPKGGNGRSWRQEGRREVPVHLPCSEVHAVSHQMAPPPTGLC